MMYFDKICKDFLKLALKEAQYEQMLVYITNLQEKTATYNL